MSISLEQLFSADDNITVAASLKKVYRLLKVSHRQYITSFYRLAGYYDEPPMSLFHADINISPQEEAFGVHGEGFDLFDASKAALKCIMEALERYALFSPLPGVKIANPEKTSEAHLSIDQIVSLSQIQRQSGSFSRWKRHPQEQYGWVRSWSLNTGRDTWIPAQLVSLNYHLLPDEPRLRMPLSTGAAAHSSLVAALYTGLCEVVERDAFMITYLNGLRPPSIDLKTNAQTRAVNQLLSDYNLEVTVFDISLDITSVSVFWAVVIDRTGLGPAVTCGLKASRDPVAGAIGAVQEALHPRSWLRDRLAEPDTQQTDLKNLEDRGIFWAQSQRLTDWAKLPFMSGKRIEFSAYSSRKQISIGLQLKELVEELKLLGVNVYAVDLTPLAIAEVGFSVASVVAPKLQPLYLQEAAKYLGGERLYQVPVKLGLLPEPKLEANLITFPHPFL